MWQCAARWEYVEIQELVINLSKRSKELRKNESDDVYVKTMNSMIMDELLKKLNYGKLEAFSLRVGPEVSFAISTIFGSIKNLQYQVQTQDAKIIEQDAKILTQDAKIIEQDAKILTQDTKIKELLDRMEAVMEIFKIQSDGSYSNERHQFIEM